MVITLDSGLGTPTVHGLETGGGAMWDSDVSFSDFYNHDDEVNNSLHPPFLLNLLSPLMELKTQLGAPVVTVVPAIL